MPRLLIVLLMLLLTACSTVEKQGNRQVTSHTSPSGQVFYHMPILEKGVTDITVRIAWPTNWARTAGLNPAVPYVGADLILSGGTTLLKPQDVLETFNDSNSQGGIIPGPDHVIGELSFPREHVEETVGIASEMLANPQLDDQWLERIKQGILAGQSDLYAMTASQMWSTARLAILGDTPLYQSVDLSDLDAIEAVTRQDILEWHASTFTRSVDAIVVTGAISAGDAGDVVDRLLEALPEGGVVDTINDDADFSPVTVLLHLPEAEKTSLGIIGQLPPTSAGGDHEDYLVIGLLSDANGPLFEALRTELRATYSVQAGYTNYARELRPFLMFGEVDTAQLDEVQKVTLQAYEDFRLAPNLSGLEELKMRVIAQTREHTQYVDVAAVVIQELLLDGMDPVTAPALHERYASVTAESIKDRLRSAFPPADELIVLAVSPDADALPGACVITAPEQVTSCR